MKTKKKVLAVILAAVVFAVAVILAGGYFFLLNQTAETGDRRSRNQFITGRTALAGDISSFLSVPPGTLEGLSLYVGENRQMSRALRVELQMTADGVLVVWPGELAEQGNAAALYGASVSVEKLTLAQLQKINLGKDFKNDADESPYDDMEDISYLTVVTLNEYANWFRRLVSGKLILSFHDESKISDPEAAMKMLCDSIEASLFDRKAVFVTENSQLLSIFDEKYPTLLRAATESEAKELFRAALLNKEIDKKSIPYDAVITGKNGIFSRFDSKRFISYAHSLDVAVMFDGVSSAKKAGRLKENGADMLFTDDIEALYNVVFEEE
ncbi:MAG: hypothetical protein FWF05_02300 [Oscillospiraceae bacterium]|nr:hypothetical protein [Oscillospiraceae bacterium]